MRVFRVFMSGLKIHRRAGHEFIEQVIGNLEAALGVGEGKENRIGGGGASRNRMPLRQPGIQSYPAVRNAARSIVRYVVGVSHECVNRTQRVSLFLRERQEPVIEVLRAGTGDSAANGIRGYKLRIHSSFPRAARATNASFRGLEIVGRLRKTLKFCRSIALSISWPPRLK